MRTKHLWLWMLLAIVAISSCKYDDTDLWNKVNSLDDRLTNIEESLTKMNTDISAMSSIINALEGNVYVSEVTETKDDSGNVTGYVIKFSDGTAATIANGKDGADGADGMNGTDGKDGVNGKDAPVIGVKKDVDGKYYWTQTIAGETTWLSDEAGNKMPVTGADAVTPLLKVNAEGYWMISYDGGLTYEEMLDEAGYPVKAVGKDGQDGQNGADGQDGANGQDGDSWFTDVEVIEKGGVRFLVITFNGEKIELPINQSLADLDKIAVTTENIGEWDRGYITPEGYFVYRENGADVRSRAVESTGEYDYLSYMSLDKKTNINILLSKEDKRPMQIVFEDNTSLYFSYLDNTTDEETVLELVYDKNGKMEKVGGFTYEFAKWNELENTLKSEDILIRVLSYFNFLTKEHCTLPSITDLTNTFADVTKLEISLDVNLDIFGLSKEEDGTFVFVADININFDIVIEKIYTELALWTGEATFKVGGSSCTLKGSIWCASPKFNDYGVYGIVCDTDKNKLALDKNPEFSGEGVQADKEFGVDFRGLKPNTTYYYRAYYKFNNTNHGNLKFINTEVSTDGQVGYDVVVKEFTTGDNTLNVDVVMCMDVTGSMGGLINTVKINALNFYDIFKEACDESGIGLTSLNTQVIAFRDKNVDGSSWLQKSDVYAMPDERAEFSNFVNGLRADGGGDTPESGLEALNEAFSKDDWGRDDGYHRQVVILWTDAPYLVGSGYTSLTVAGLEPKWDAMPSGRRLILFAPNGTLSNGGSWGELDSWTNVMHILDTATGFEDMDYVIDNIIGELTGKGKSGSIAPMKSSASLPVIFRPNE